MNIAACAGKRSRRILLINKKATGMGMTGFVWNATINIFEAPYEHDEKNRRVHRKQIDLEGKAILYVPDECYPLIPEQSFPPVPEQSFPLVAQGQ
jgi:hypothetical protein